MSVETTCDACRMVRGELVPPGGILLREHGLCVHALSGPSPLRGWLVITSETHARALYDLDDEPTAHLALMARKMMRLQREVLGAEHVYAFAIGDVLKHFHLHLVPRYSDTPMHLRGRGAFTAADAEQLRLKELEDAAGAIGRALAR